MRPTFDVVCKKALDPLVDKTIGNAYETVNYVADHMDELLALTPRETDTRYVQGLIGLLGSTATIPLPVDISVNIIRSSTVQLRTIGGVIHNESSGYFTVALSAAGLVVTLKPTAPLALQNSVVLWTIVFGVINE